MAERVASPFLDKAGWVRRTDGLAGLGELVCLQFSLMLTHDL
jgi:hypothetical protein